MLLVVFSVILIALGSVVANPTAFADTGASGASDTSLTTPTTTGQSTKSGQQSGSAASDKDSKSADTTSPDNGSGSLAAGSVASSEDEAKSAESAWNTTGGTAQKTVGTKKQSMKVSAQYGYYYASRAALQDHALYIYYPVNVKNSHGKLTYSNCSKNSAAKQLKVNSKTGRITVPKGYSKSLATLKIRVRAAGNSEYAAASKVVSMKIRLSAKKRGAAQAAINEWWHGMRNGTNNAGGQKYWSAWYDKRKAWCSEFVGWCLIDSGYEPGVNMPSRPVNAPQYMAFYKKNPSAGKVIKVTAKTKFKPGDILIRCNKNGKPSHTGMAVKYYGRTLTAIEGNGHDIVVKREYSGKSIKKRWAYCIRIAS